MFILDQCKEPMERKGIQGKIRDQCMCSRPRSLISFLLSFLLAVPWDDMDGFIPMYLMRDRRQETTNLGNVTYLHNACPGYDVRPGSGQSGVFLTAGSSREVDRAGDCSVEEVALSLLMFWLPRPEWIFCVPVP